MSMYCKGFTAWWLIYPRKAAKRVAYLKWQNAVVEIAAERECSKDEAMEWLNERTKLFASSPKGQSAEFCPYPSTWLFQGRYDDDVDEWRRGHDSGMRALRGPELDELKSQEWRP